MLGSDCRGVVAIPACNEADRISNCLAALAVQHDGSGRPLKPGVFAVLVLANNCTDSTVAVVQGMQDLLPFPLVVIERSFAPPESNAGCARKAAMDAAVALFGEHGPGIIFTTDADSTVNSTWVANSVAAFDAGADAVAGYIEAQPEELLSLGPAFLRRGRLEDSYLSGIAEVMALCDPQPHDPWPTHRVSSGASLAVSLAAYRAIGGLPAKPLGEDVALSVALLDAGFRIRHAMDVVVTTSCRFDGRATGGAADTMRQRHLDPDAPCDDAIEPAHVILLRALSKGRLRRWFAGNDPAGGEKTLRRLGMKSGCAASLQREHGMFEPLWRAVEEESPKLQQARPLRPSALPAELERMHRLLGRLRRLAHRGAVRPIREQDYRSRIASSIVLSDELLLSQLSSGERAVSGGMKSEPVDSL